MRNRRHQTKISIINKVLLCFLLAIIAVTIYTYRRDLRDLFIADDRYDVYINEAAVKNGIDPLLVKAVIYQETRFKPDARGSKGEVGLMQIIPASSVKDWATEHKVEVPCNGLLFQPKLNIEIGSWYLARALKHWKKYKHDIELALCEYNAGGKYARQWAPENPEDPVIDRIKFPGTKAYVASIMEKYREYRDAENENTK